MYVPKSQKVSQTRDASSTARNSSNKNFRLRCYQLLLGKSVWIEGHLEMQSGEESSSFDDLMKNSSPGCISQRSSIQTDFPTTQGILIELVSSILYSSVVCRPLYLEVCGSPACPISHTSLHLKFKKWPTK